MVNQVIKACVRTLKGGGRIVFTGAAHSGYLGSLDAFEANATFGTNGEFVSVVAGNATDIMHTDGSAEDSAENGALDLPKAKRNRKGFRNRNQLFRKNALCNRSIAVVSEERSALCGSGE